MEEERTEHTSFCFPRSHNLSFSTNEGVLVFKRRRKERVRRTEDSLKASANDAEFLCNMVRPTESPLNEAKEMVEATTSASIQAPPTLKGGMSGIGYPTNLVSPSNIEPTNLVSPSNEQPTNLVTPPNEQPTNLVPPPSTGQPTNLVPPSNGRPTNLVPPTTQRPTTLVPPSTKQPKHVVHIKSEPSEEELVDFRGLAMLPRHHASLLVRACIDHPNLAICPPQKLKRWREFAYGTLGELLFFLTSTRRKEMTHKACEVLKELWEEAQELGFDLSWLAPIVESGLGSSSELANTRSLEVRKDGLKECKDTLQCLLTTLTKKLTKVEKKLAAVEVLKKRRNTLHCQLTTLTMQLIEVDKGLSVWENLFRCAKEEQERVLFLFPDV